MAKNRTPTAIATTRATWLAPGRRAPRDAIVLARRGARLGSVRIEAELACGPRELAARWRADRPIVLRGVFSRSLGRWRAELGRTLAFFERVRGGASLQDELWSRALRVKAFKPAGSSVDLGDVREIEKVFAHRRRRRRLVARDLWAKLSWIAADERDASLRIRFSFGAESLLEWFDDPRRAVHADALSRAMFPECALLEEQLDLRRLLERLNGRRVRLSERIVYSNAPGGGAIFHHDAEPWQLGVVFGQFVGETAWFALPKRELATLVAPLARGPAARRRFGTPARALRELDREDAPELAKLLNQDPRLARTLVEHGAFFHLRAGDAILMPSHGPDDVCWHSVFALGRQPSLAHSYGIFSARRRRDDPLAKARTSSPGGEARLSS